MKKLLNVEETATLLGISPHTLRGCVSRKQIRHVKIGRRCLFRPEDIAEMISDGLCEPLPRRGVHD